MLILVFKRKFQKNFLKFNKIPTIILKKKNNIFLEINNNKYYYNILKFNQILEILFLNKKFLVKITDIIFHPYKKYILSLDLKHINMIEKFN